MDLGYLTGRFHDMGKAASQVQAHLRGETAEKHNHSSAGMRWLWEHRLDTTAGCIAAQMGALAIGCHHSGRCDVFSLDGKDAWMERMYAAPTATSYEECVRRFFGECGNRQEIEERIRSASQEVTHLVKKLVRCFPGKGEISQNSLAFALGMVQRFLFSALIDADWTDTACFMHNQSLPQTVSDEERRSLWETLAQRVEEKVESLPIRYPVDKLRRELSRQCRDAGRSLPPGIYRLCIPTGGGKTYAGLRFCMQMAQRQNARHVFYVAPYKSITGQNTQCIRDAVGSAEAVLEHHSDVTAALGDEEEKDRWLSQNQRWEGAPVICTTMVQFLNTLFAAPRQNVRRLQALQNSILLFDEIQALPVQDTYLFNLAVQTLTQVMGCTVVLCTATQPPLEEVSYPLVFSKPVDLVPYSEELFSRFRRVQIVPWNLNTPVRAPALADFAEDLLKENRSVLIILNTKAAVHKLFDQLKSQLPQDTALFCLTNALCPAHRKAVLGEVRDLLETRNKKLICVSTQLIEAGVDLSFDCVARSMAGLPSILQAAGRCNRHGEDPCRKVCLFRCADEDLRYLPEIDDGLQATCRLLEILPPGEDLLSPQAIQKYYQIYYARMDKQETLSHPVCWNDGGGPQQATLLDLLSRNPAGVNAFISSGHPLPKAGMLCQAFGTAEGKFQAIADETIPVVVPYGKGVERIAQLLSDRESPWMLPNLQPYTVAVSQATLHHLESKQAIRTAGEDTLRILLPAFYHPQKGVITEPQMLDPLFT